MAFSEILKHIGMSSSAKAGYGKIVKMIFSSAIGKIDIMIPINIDFGDILPHIPDKWYAFAVAKTYYKELIEGGVQIYEYTPGFVHAKVFVSDDDTATVGSINLDFRSLYLHFENGVFIYDNPEVQKVEEDFQNTLAKCHKVTVTEVRNRGVLMKVAGQVLRLVAPLM